MAEEKKEEKKIIIDEDWKSKAQKEKEVLKAKEEAEKEDKQENRAPLPPADFSGLVSILTTQAFFALGIIRNEEDKDKTVEPDWQMARYHIDMLAMLEEKCKGNLTADETRLLANTLEQLRMTFVKLSK